MARGTSWVTVASVPMVRERDDTLMDRPGRTSRPDDLSNSVGPQPIADAANGIIPTTSPRSLRRTLAALATAIFACCGSARVSR
jgi:hypothetical protein